MFTIARDVYGYYTMDGAEVSRYVRALRIMIFDKHGQIDPTVLSNAIGRAKYGQIVTVYRTDRGWTHDKIGVFS